MYVGLAGVAQFTHSLWHRGATWRSCDLSEEPDLAVTQSRELKANCTKKL